MAFKFLMKGDASVQAAVQQKKDAEIAKALRDKDKIFRFFLKKGGKTTLTFIDGDLNENGILAPPRYYEHSLYLNGSWGHFFICPKETKPSEKDFCPICQSGDKPTLVAVFSVIDHSIFIGKNDKKYQHTKKLLVVKPGSFDILAHHATKRGGLATARFEVLRAADDKSPSIGSSFDFEEKLPLKQLQATYLTDPQPDPKTGKKPAQTTNFTPFDYEEILEWRSGQELADLGLGKPKDAPPIGSVTEKKTDEDLPDYSEQM